MEIGGQAVLEGVMLRKKDKIAIAIRKNKKIKTTSFKFSFLPKLKKPFLRGIISLIETIYIGFKSLNWSAEQIEGEKTSKTSSILLILISFIIAIGLFIFLPLYLTKLLISSKGFYFNLVDGIFRILIFFGYLTFISFSKEIKKTFQYHGAEHKVVNCYEDNKKVTIKNCRRYSTLHVRCGTSFIFIVLIISILVFSVIYSEKLYIRFLGRIVLIPVIASLSYEILKLAAKYKTNIFFNLISKPGLFLQKFTTKRPNKKQLEVAIAAFKKLW